MDPEDMADCYFVPKGSIERAINFLGNEKVSNSASSHCKIDLRKLQMRYLMTTQVNKNVKVLAHQYHLALHRAIYSHDWNKLLYLLKKSPIWEQNPKSLDGMPIYIRAFAILLMYHPSAQAQNLLMEYMHMVCTCRSDVEKKALMKLILTLPEKLIQKVFSFHKNCKWFQDVE